MDEDKLKGKLKDAAGRAERQVGEWTDNEKLQGEGAARQAEGKAQKGLGKLKEMGRDAINRADREVERRKAEREIRKDRDKDAA